MPGIKQKKINAVLQLYGKGLQASEIAEKVKLEKPAVEKIIRLSKN